MPAISPKVITNAIETAISLNPTTITIKEKKKEQIDGAWKTTNVEKDLTVIIFFEDAYSKFDISSQILGTEYKSSKWQMVADKDADLNLNPDSNIKFESNGQKFKIASVYPVIIQDILCGYICNLERYF